MIFNMPFITFTFLLWPIIWIVCALIIYQVMAKQDARMDDAEFTTIARGGAKS